MKYNDNKASATNKYGQWPYTNLFGYNGSKSIFGHYFGVRMHMKPKLSPMMLPAHPLIME